MTRRPAPSRIAYALVAVLVACGSDPAAPPFVQTVDISGLPVYPLFMGTTLQLTAVARDPQGNDITTLDHIWTSTDEWVATVSATGLVTPLATGDVIIRVDVGQNFDMVELPVRYGAIMTGDGQEYSTPDGVMTFNVGFPGDPRPQAYWAQPVDPPVAHARIVPGTVFEVAVPGQEEYTQGYLFLSYDPEVVADSIVALYTFSESMQKWRPHRDWTRVDSVANRVEGPISLSGTYALFRAPVASAQIGSLPDENRILVTGTYRVTAVAFDDDGNVLPLHGVTWRSSNESVMTVIEDDFLNAEDGYITGVAPGFATLTADVQGVEVSVEIEVVPIG